MLRSVCLASAALVALAAPAFAHPGHDVGWGVAAGLAHPFSGLDHLLVMIAAGLWASQATGNKALLAPLALASAYTVFHGHAAIAFDLGLLAGSLALVGVGAALGRASTRLLSQTATRAASWATLAIAGVLLVA